MAVGDILVILSNFSKWQHALKPPVHARVEAESVIIDSHYDNRYNYEK